MEVYNGPARFVAGDHEADGTANFVIEPGGSEWLGHFTAVDGHLLQAVGEVTIVLPDGRSGTIAVRDWSDDSGEGRFIGEGPPPE